jgi:hypothetical protein
MPPHRLQAAVVIAGLAMGSGLGVTALASCGGGDDDDCADDCGFTPISDGNQVDAGFGIIDASAIDAADDEIDADIDADL